MPNWCNNYITITGDKPQLEKIHFLASNRGEDGLFVTLVGLPEGMTPTDYNDKWYDTNVSQWGTKWDVHPHETEIVKSDFGITMSLETAWSPPIPFCAQLAEIFKVEVSIFYSEPGIGFAGLCKCYADGTIEDDECEYLEGMYRHDTGQFWSEIESTADSIMDELTPAEEDGKVTEEDIKSYVDENYGFVTDEDRVEILKQLNEQLDDQD